MVFKDGKLCMSYGVMGGDIQPQGHVQVLVNLVDRGLDLQQAIDAPRLRYISGRDVMMEPELTQPVIDALVAKGHHRAMPDPGLAAPRPDGRRPGHHDRPGDRRPARRVGQAEGRARHRILIRAREIPRVPSASRLRSRAPRR